jgi:hypothetical protein
MLYHDGQEGEVLVLCLAPGPFFELSKFEKGSFLESMYLKFPAKSHFYRKINIQKEWQRPPNPKKWPLQTVIDLCSSKCKRTQVKNFLEMNDR